MVFLFQTGPLQRPRAPQSELSRLAPLDEDEPVPLQDEQQRPYLKALRVYTPPQAGQLIKELSADPNASYRLEKLENGGTYLAFAPLSVAQAVGGGADWATQSQPGGGRIVVRDFVDNERSPLIPQAAASVAAQGPDLIRTVAFIIPQESPTTYAANEAIRARMAAELAARGVGADKVTSSVEPLTYGRMARGLDAENWKGVRSALLKGVDAQGKRLDKAALAGLWDAQSLEALRSALSARDGTPLFFPDHRNAKDPDMALVERAFYQPMRQVYTSFEYGLEVDIHAGEIVAKASNPDLGLAEVSAIYRKLDGKPVTLVRGGGENVECVFRFDPAVRPEPYVMVKETGAPVDLAEYTGQAGHSLEVRIDGQLRLKTVQLVADHRFNHGQEGRLSDWALRHTDLIKGVVAKSANGADFAARLQRSSRELGILSKRMQGEQDMDDTGLTRPKSARMAREWSEALALEGGTEEAVALYDMIKNAAAVAQGQGADTLSRFGQTLGVNASHREEELQFLAGVLAHLHEADAPLARKTYSDMLDRETLGDKAHLRGCSPLGTCVSVLVNLGGLELDAEGEARLRGRIYAALMEPKDRTLYERSLRKMGVPVEVMRK